MEQRAKAHFGSLEKVSLAAAFFRTGLRCEGRASQSDQPRWRVSATGRSVRYPCYGKATFGAILKGIGSSNSGCNKREGPVIDQSRRAILTAGAAAAATTAAAQVFAQSPQAAAQGLPAGAKVGFYEKGNARIRYAEIGTGFPLLATPGGGLNSRIANWPAAVINVMEEFK